MIGQWSFVGALWLLLALGSALEARAEECAKPSLGVEGASASGSSLLQVHGVSNNSPLYSAQPGQRQPQRVQQLQRLPGRVGVSAPPLAVSGPAAGQHLEGVTSVARLREEFDARVAQQQPQRFPAVAQRPPAGASMVPLQPLAGRSTAAQQQAQRPPASASTVPLVDTRPDPAPTRTAPCKCQADGPWLPPLARPSRCVFIDLGAANGNTFNFFMGNGYGDVASCPSQGSFEAILVEANPVFNDPLNSVRMQFPLNVRAMPSTAAYMCEGTTSFYLDTVSVDKNWWGSSLSPDARDVMQSGMQKVTVPLVNLMRLLTETVTKEDYVVLKMDIEGAEHDILPCLAKSKAASLVDALFVEKHPAAWSLSQAPVDALDNALLALQQLGVKTPDYDSPSL